ncbi:MAG: acyltransferase family protein [Deltaproteobacteria bacterium]|nr:acyltransferase family protein [Deltaproteobacteria bacterium]
MARRVVDLRPADVAPTPPRRRRRRRGDADHEAFGQRLRELEREIEEALAGIAEGADYGAWLRGVGEEVLGFYADLGRAFMESGLGGAFVRLRMVGTADRVDDFGYDPAFHARVEPLVRALYEQWWRVEAAGLDHVPLSGRLLLVGNHSGGVFPYDGMMIAEALRAHHPGGGRQARPLVEDFVYQAPFLGPLLARMGVVRASSQNARRLLAREQAVIAFPEGAKGLGKYYRERYRLQRFARGGFVSLALQSGAPLVPVAVVGAEEIHPVLARWGWAARGLDLPYFPVTPTFPWLGLLGLVPLPTKWRVVFGAPIDLAAQYGPDAHRDELLVNRLKEEIRERIQRMLVAALSERRSVFA